MALLDRLNADRRMASSAELIALDVTTEYLLINIGELERRNSRPGQRSYWLLTIFISSTCKQKRTMVI